MCQNIPLIAALPRTRSSYKKHDYKKHRATLPNKHPLKDKKDKIRNIFNRNFKKCTQRERPLYV